MSMISEQVKELRRKTKRIGFTGIGVMLMQAADTIEALSAKLQADNGGGWIACEDRLPEEKTNPVTQDFYEYQVTFQCEYAKDVRHYKFGNGHWWNGPDIMDEYVTAWRVPIEPYCH